jgi:hypothetical protein
VKSNAANARLQWTTSPNFINKNIYPLNVSFKADFEVFLFQKITIIYLEKVEKHVIMNLYRNKKEVLHMKKKSIRSIPMVVVSVVLIVLSLLSVVMLPASAAGLTLLGDVNEDGIVKVNDAKLTLRQSMGLTITGGFNEKNADWDNDGKVTITDSRNILRYALGLQKYPAWYKGEDATTLPPTETITMDPNAPTVGWEEGTTEDFSDRATFYETFISRDTGRTLKNVWICKGCGKRLPSDGYCNEEGCPYYNELKDASKYCQQCGLPLGTGVGYCPGPPIDDIVCSRCGELIKKGTCHHNCKNNIVTSCPYCHQSLINGICYEPSCSHYMKKVG